MESIHIRILDDVINHQTSLLKSAQNVVSNTLQDNDVSPNLRTSTELRFLNLYGSNASLFENVKQQLVTRQAYSSETSNEMQVSYEIIQAFFILMKPLIADSSASGCLVSSFLCMYFRELITVCLRL